MELNKIIQGDCLEVLKTIPNESIDCMITSPPYWALRDYGVEGQLGLEPTFQEYITKLCDIFEEVKRVLKKEGTCWVNLGDTYMGNSSYSKDGRQGFGNDKIGMMNKKKWLDPKNPIEGKLRAREHVEKGQTIQKSLVMIPERFAIEMCNRGWILRNKIIWHKKNAMPSSVVDRLSNKYEIVYFFTKNTKYNFDLDSIRIPFETEDNDRRPQGQRRVREMGYNTKFGSKNRNLEESSQKLGHRRPPQASGEYERNPKGKNPGDVWTLTMQPHPEAHIAMYPEKLIIPMVKAGCPQGGVVLDIFMGAGTTALVAKNLGRKYLGIELNPEYIKIAEDRVRQEVLL